METAQDPTPPPLHLPNTHTHAGAEGRIVVDLEDTNLQSTSGSGGGEGVPSAHMENKQDKPTAYTQSRSPVLGCSNTKTTYSTK